ncbi:FAD-dependent monooxygenase [Sphaerisporangium fuscum]|uniref:FAD-dependent monooxygenase n=1 Tax=Sphaerisporangium fuscum TaxID=2835868 RepID=UPI001BDC8ABF|nr:FAD-dependent monooxygenase [Sphaerisporangium fuscum]
MSLEELSAALRRVLGADLPIAAPEGPGPHLLRRLSGRNTRLAERYRQGRVLLAGDAAHVHSAMGAPGLNLGLQDVANLGWKLAAEVAGRAPPGLLDTYEAERRPAADRVVEVVAAACDHPPAQAMLIRPDGYLAWAAGPHDPDEEAAATLRLALTTWFGEEGPTG